MLHEQHNYVTKNIKIHTVTRWNMHTINALQHVHVDAHTHRHTTERRVGVFPVFHICVLLNNHQMSQEIIPTTGACANQELITFFCLCIKF